MAFEHLQWLWDERRCGAKYEMVALRVLAAAKFLWGDEDEEDDTERPYANVRSFDNFERSTRGEAPKRGSARTSANGYPGISTSTSCGAWKTSARRGCTTAGRGATAPWRGVCSDFSSSVCCRACGRQHHPWLGWRTLCRNRSAAEKRARREGERRLVGRGSGDRERRAHRVDRPEDLRDGEVRVSVGD